MNAICWEASGPWVGNKVKWSASFCWVGSQLLGLYIKHPFFAVSQLLDHVIGEF
jgi:hypothetical protein